MKSFARIHFIQFTLTPAKSLPVVKLREICYNVRAMVEWIRLVRGRGLTADILHGVFNLSFAAAVLAIVMIFPDTPWPALALVLLAKWRVIAVRPRYWWTNFLSSLPDTLLGFGVVTLMWQSGMIGASLGIAAWPVQIALGLFYAVWLILIKPQYKHVWVLVQSGLSEFIAIMAIFSVAYRLPLAAVVLLAFATGFAAARQVSLLYEEKAHMLLSLIWGLAVSELAFAAWHWTVAYQITPLLKIPQIAIIIAVLAFATERVYSSYHKNQQINWNDAGWPIIFAVVVSLMLVFVFGGLWGI
jgi:hypothetical protein